MARSLAVITNLFLSGLLWSVATAAPNPGGPFFWPLGKQTPKPHGYNELKHDPPFNDDQCATLAEPFKGKLEDCLWVPYGYGADCVRTKLTEKEYEIYDSLYHWGCIVPGVSGHVGPNFVRRDMNLVAADNDGKQTHKSHGKETALPPLSDYTKQKSKSLLPLFTREQCQHIEKSFKSRTIACGLKPKAQRYACVASNLNRQQWRSFKEAVQRGCEFSWMKGDTRGQLLVRRDRGKPDTHRPPWMSSWNGDHWDAWEKYENVKLKNFVINKLDFLTPDIPANWLLHYPFSGGKGRVGKWNDEHPKPRIDISREGKPHGWDANVKRSASKRSHILRELRRPLTKRQRLLPPDPWNPDLTRASQHNNNVPEIPDWERESNAVPTFEGRRCYVVNQYDQRVTYEEAKKDENGYVRVKCLGPEISSPDAHYHKQDYTEPIQERTNKGDSAKEGREASQAADNEDHELTKRQFLPPAGSDHEWTNVSPWKYLTMTLDAHKNEWNMAKSSTYNKADWQATHKEHWAEQPVYFKNHQLGRDCYNMNFHYTTMTCYFMWKPGSG